MVKLDASPIRIPNEMHEAIGVLAQTEARSKTMMTQILLGYALNHYPGYDALPKRTVTSE